MTDYDQVDKLWVSVHHDASFFLSLYLGISTPTFARPTYPPSRDRQCKMVPWIAFAHCQSGQSLPQALEADCRPSRADRTPLHYSDRQLHHRCITTTLVSHWLELDPAFG